MAHTVTAPVERAHVVQSEFAKVRHEYLDHIGQAVDTLPQSTLALIEQGEPVRADYYLRSNEAMLGIISHEAFQTYMKAAIADGNPA